MSPLPIVLGALAVAALVGAAGRASASSSSPEQMPAELVERIVEALATRNPRTMRELAGELRALGYTQQAADLSREAALLEKEQASGTKPKPATTTPKPSTPKPSSSSTSSSSSSSSSSSTTTAVPTPSAPTAGLPQGPVSDPKQLLAAEVVRGFAKGKPDANKIRQFQVQEGLTADGKYGPKSATSLIKYGLVPPSPMVWPAQNTNAAKTAYVALLTSQMHADPVRAEEWRIAIQAVKGKGGGGAVNHSVVSSTPGPLTTKEDQNLRNLVAKTVMDQQFATSSTRGL